MSKCAYKSAEGRTCKKDATPSGSYCVNHGCPSPGCKNGKSSSAATCTSCVGTVSSVSDAGFGFGEEKCQYRNAQGRTCKSAALPSKFYCKHHGCPKPTCQASKSSSESMCTSCAAKSSSLTSVGRGRGSLRSTGSNGSGGSGRGRGSRRDSGTSMAGRELPPIPPPETPPAKQHSEFEGFGDAETDPVISKPEPSYVNTPALASSAKPELPPEELGEMYVGPTSSVKTFSKIDRPASGYQNAKSVGGGAAEEFGGFEEPLPTPPPKPAGRSSTFASYTGDELGESDESDYEDIQRSPTLSKIVDSSSPESAKKGDGFSGRDYVNMAAFAETLDQESFDGFAARDRKSQKRGSALLFDTPEDGAVIPTDLTRACRNAQLEEKGVQELSKAGVKSVPAAVKLTTKDLTQMGFTKEEAKKLAAAIKREAARPKVVEKIAMLYAIDGDVVAPSFTKDEKAVAVDIETLADLVGGDLSILDFEGDGEGVTPQQVFDKLDANKDGCVSVHEFLKVFDPVKVRDNRRRLSSASLEPTSPRRDSEYDSIDNGGDASDEGASGPSPALPEESAAETASPKKEKKQRRKTNSGQKDVASPTSDASPPESPGEAATILPAVPRTKTEPKTRVAVLHEDVPPPQFGDWVPEVLPEDEFADSELWEAGIFDDDLPRLSMDVKVLQDLIEEEVDKEALKKEKMDTKKKKKEKKASKKTAGEDDSDGDDDGDENSEDEEQEEEEDEEDEEGGISGPQHIAYGKPPPMCMDPIVDMGELEKAETWPKGTPNEADTLLTKLMIARKKFVKMGLRRNAKPGVKLWLEIVEAETELLERIDKMSPDELNARNKKGKTMIAICCKQNWRLLSDIRKKLLAAKVDLEIPDKNGRTPMHHACKNKSPFLVRTLLEHGANPNVASKKKEIPLLQTMRLYRRKKLGELKSAQYIVLSGKANLDAGYPGKKENPDPAPIIQVLSKKRPQYAEPYVHLLTFHGCDVNVRKPSKDPVNKPGKSALRIALRAHPRQFSYSIDALARENSATGGSAPMDESIYNDYDSEKEAPPLFLMCLYRQSEGVANLLRLGADGSDPTKQYKAPKMKGIVIPRCTAFEAACFSGAGLAVRMFIQRDEKTFKPVLIGKPQEWTEKWKGVYDIPLIVTAVLRSSHADAVHFADLTIAYKISVNNSFEDVDNMTLFKLYVALGHMSSCKKLLTANENGELELDVHTKDTNNRNCVFYSAYACHDDRSFVLMRVLELGADPNIVDRFGVTPLLAACRNNDEYSVAILLNKKYTFKNLTVPNPKYTKLPKKGLPIHAKAKGDGVHGGAQTPHSAFPRNPSGACREDQDNLKFIPRKPYTPGKWDGVSGEELNRADHYGFTPLWYAVLNCNADIVRMLISNPVVNVNCVNTANPFGIHVGEKMSPLMLAACVIPRGKLDIFFMLLNHPKVDLSIKNSRGHTVRDIAFMQEIEFLVRPMTDALTQRKDCPSLHSHTKAIKHFENPQNCKWWLLSEEGLTVDDEDAQKWDTAIANVPFYGWRPWLLSVTRYDWHARRGPLKTEQWRQGLELAKIASFKASYGGAVALRFVAGSTVSEAAKFAVKKAEQFWWVAKGQNIRGYDKEYMLAQMDGNALQFQTNQDFVGRRHIPEDIKHKRYALGRFSKLKAPAFYTEYWKSQGGEFKERWILKP